MKEFLAELSISKFFNSNTVQIVINDESSGCHVLEMEITLEAFAKALFSQGDMAGTAKVYLDAPIGKVIETKAEVVPRPEYVDRELRPAIAETILAPYEVDGWKARADDLWNSHKWRGNDLVEVTFFRYVDREGKA